MGEAHRIRPGSQQYLLFSSSSGNSTRIFRKRTTRGRSYWLLLSLVWSLLPHSSSAVRTSVLTRKYEVSFYKCAYDDRVRVCERVGPRARLDRTYSIRVRSSTKIDVSSRFEHLRTYISCLVLIVRQEMSKCDGPCLPVFVSKKTSTAVVYFVWNMKEHAPCLFMIQPTTQQYEYCYTTAVMYEVWSMNMHDRAWYHTTAAAAVVVLKIWKKGEICHMYRSAVNI